jgi:tRNA dimethylallyltransferase
MRPLLVFLVGPTAVGKTAVSIHLAKKLHAEIISCDSMQVYRGMDILTSKPSVRQRKEVRHHLLGICACSREYDVSQYRAQALKQVKRILQRRRMPLFVGGTGLYMTVLLDGIFQAPAQDPAIRSRFVRQMERSGSAVLHRRLAEVDPDAAARIHPNDGRRIIRALEVHALTGKPISLLQKQRSGLAQDHDVRVFCLELPRKELYRRIDSRVERMFVQGAVAEVRRLRRKKISRTAGFAIGFREIGAFLDGTLSLAQCKELMKRNSRQYAKRQLTWFRKDKRITWIRLRKKDTPAAIARSIWKKLCL